MDSLPLFHRIKGRSVIVLGEGEAAMAKQRLVERAGGIVTSDPRARVQLAFVALDEPEAAVAKLRARGILVNCVDRPELCDFTTPALVDRDPVLIAVGTGGASAGLAKALRLRLDRLLPARLGELATALHAARQALRDRWPGLADRRRALDSALEQGGALDPFRDESLGAVPAWLGAAPASHALGGEVLLTSLDPDDLTLRAARLLGGADVVAYEPGVPHAILDRARADAARTEIAAGAPTPLDRGVVVIVRMPRTAVPQ